ncbi:MAG TPA: hypothetical protein VGM18_11025 [Candidatus Sulfotelmatobacter sp.]|jgi:hypothetical protein
MPEDRLQALEKRVEKLESRFNLAATVALFLGISVAGLGSWVKVEAANVKELTDEVRALDPFVKEAKAQLERAGQEQLALIRTKADPIVERLTKDKFADLSGALKNGSQGEIYSSNPQGEKLPNDKGDKNLDCPKGQFVTRVGVHWIGPNISYVATTCGSPLN